MLNAEQNWLEVDVEPVVLRVTHWGIHVVKSSFVLWELVGLPVAGAPWPQRVIQMEATVPVPHLGLVPLGTQVRISPRASLSLAACHSSLFYPLHPLIYQIPMGLIHQASLGRNLLLNPTCAVFVKIGFYQ